MKTITILILSILILKSTIDSNNSITECLEADIILVADLSGSVRGHERFIADAFDTFVNRFKLSEHGVRIGAYAFSNEALLISHLTDDKKQLLGATDIIRNNPLGRSTNLSGAIDATYNELVANWRRGSRKIVILISDGEADNMKNFLASIDRLKDDLGAEVCGIYISTATGDSEAMANISEPFCYVSSNYEELANTLERLTICG